LASIARLEAAGIRPPRLTEPEHQRWQRFRRNLSCSDLIDLLHQDLAMAFPEPFGRHQACDLDDEQAKALLLEAASPSEEPSSRFLLRQAEALRLPTGGALSNAPQLQPQHQILELPGSGGRLSAYLCARDQSLGFDRQFTLMADSEEERCLIGLVTVELRGNAPRVWSSEQLEEELAKGARFDRVLGLKAAPGAQRWAPRFPEVRLL